jgi:hypothetical protein
MHKPRRGEPPGGAAPHPARPVVDRGHLYALDAQGHLLEDIGSIRYPELGVGASCPCGADLPRGRDA